MQDNKLGRSHKIYTQRVSNKLFFRFVTYFLIVVLLVVLTQLFAPNPDVGISYLSAVICGFFAWYCHKLSSSKISIWHDPKTDVVRILDDWNEIGRLKLDFSKKKSHSVRDDYVIAEVLYDEIPFQYRHTITAIRKGRFLVNCRFLKRC